MSGKNKNTGFYTARDIQKYLEGELSAPEMYALEKAALEDPFLADALEGIGNHRLMHGETSFQSELDELSQRLENRITEKNRRRTLVLTHSRWRVAAAIILLSGLAAGAYRYLFNEKRSPALARSEKPVAVTDSTAAVAAIPENRTVPAVPAKPVNPAVPAKPVNGGNPANRRKPKIQAGREEQLVRVNPATTDKFPPAATDKFSPAATDKFSISATEKYLKKSISSPLTSDNSANRLNRQMLARPAQKELKSLDSLSPTPSGAVKAGTTLQGKAAGIAVRKSQDSNLDEVVVAGYLRKSKKMISGSVSSAKPDSLGITGQLAEPSGGWQEFKSWLERNKRTGIANSTITGNEIISFRVNKKGVLSSFKIEHSLSPAHDTEAIRLLNEGPAWKLLKGRKTRVRVVVSY